MARRSGAWRGIAAAAGAVLAAGCIGGGSSAESAPTPLAPATEEPTQTPTLTPTGTPSPTPTPTPEDPFAVPEEIDLEYLDRVIAELYTIESEGFRQMVLAGRVDEETSAYLEVTRTPRGAQRQREAERASAHLKSVEARETAGLVGVPGDTAVQAVQLMEIVDDPRCVFVEVTEDHSASVLIEDPKPIYAYLVLVAKDPGNHANDRNPTPWVIDFWGTNTEDQHAPLSRDVLGHECSDPTVRPVD